MEISPVEISWLKLFFSPPNDIHWGDFNSTKVDAHLRDELIAWVSSFGAQNCEIVLLPCLKDGTTIWYVCSPILRLWPKFERRWRLSLHTPTQT